MHDETSPARRGLLKGATATGLAASRRMALSDVKHAVSPFGPLRTFAICSLPRAGGGLGRGSNAALCTGRTLTPTPTLPLEGGGSQSPTSAAEPNA